MRAERWHEVSELLYIALRVPPAEREALLEARCEDAEVRREVLDLLGAEGEADGVLRALRRAFYGPESQADCVRAGEGEVIEGEGDPRADDPWMGVRVGSYVLEEKIDEGGMGAVYRARRADEAYESRVAVKILAGGFFTGERVRRFHRERQILASLDHPNIARLLDGGTAPDGRPYLVMEHVEGLPIDVFCDRHRLGVDARLELFRRVCEAVQAAHQSLVVHRDLKPANVLVTAGGVPKLLDFGIAKLLEGTSLPAGGEATLTGLRPMTLCYASPEQVEGGRITTASDVYSLGVMLYELLVGRLPYRSGERIGEAGAPGPLSFSEAILHEEAVRPSLRVTTEIARRRGASPRQLRRRLAGDLDNIVLTALAKAPERRYGAAEQLGADLGRYLRGLPVEARPASFGYRLSKLVRRKPLLSALAAVSLVTVLVFSIAMARLADRLAEERDRARLHQARAESVAGFLTDLFTISEPERSRGEAVTAREMLDRGVERIHDGLEDQPETRAALLVSMGEAYLGLGLYDSARPLLEEALELRGQALGPMHPETLESLSLLASAYQRSGDFARAERLHREVLARTETVYGADSLEVADVLSSLAFFARVRADYGAVEGLLERALRIQEAREGREVATARIETLQRLSGLFSERRKLARAEKLLREAVAAKAELLGEDHPDVLMARAEMGNLARYRGRAAEVEGMLRETLAAQRRILGAAHPHIPYTLTSLGLALVELDRAAEGETYLQEALDQRVRLLGPDHAASGVSYQNLAYCRERLGRYEEALELYSRAREVMAKSFGAENPLMAHPLSGLGRVHLALGEPEKAEPLLRRAVELHRRRSRPGDPLLGRAESELGACLAALGRDEEAEQLLRSGWSAHAGNAPVAEVYRREVRERLARFYRERGREDESARLGVEVASPSPPPTDPSSG